MTYGKTGRELGEQAIDYCLSFPERHDQNTECGSKGCLVGWINALHYGMVTPVRGWISTREYARRFGGGVSEAIDSVYYPQGVASAARLLGVPPSRLVEEVYVQMDKDVAISNLKHLLDTS